MREVDLRSDELFDLSKDIFAQGNRITFKAHGRSMHPTIQDGDVLEIEAAAASDLKVGEVVFFRSAGGKPTVHRLIGRKMSDGLMALIMQGDAAAGEDAPVQPEEIFGRVVNIQRGEKTIVFDRPWKVFFMTKILLINRATLLLSGSCKRVVAALLMKAQGIKIYRLIARRLIGNKVRYSVAGADDAPELSRLYGYQKYPEFGDPIEAFAAQIESLTGGGYILVGDIMGKIAGAVVVTECPWSPTLDPDHWLFGMLVRTRYRGAGIGEGLMRMALEKTSEAGRKGMSLFVSEHNKAAVNLYFKMGFKPSPIPYKDIEHKTGYQNQDFVALSKHVEPPKNSSLDQENAVIH